MKRHNLYMLRCDKRLTQAEIADKLGVSRQVYANIEKGRNAGSTEFWSNLQKVFNIPDADMYPLQKMS